MIPLGILAAAVRRALTPSLGGVWDAAASGPGIAFSEDGRLATKSSDMGDYFTSAKGATGHPHTEHRYFELEVVASPSAFKLFGIGRGSAPVDTFVGNTPDGWSIYQETGQKHTAGVGETYGPPIAAGDVIGVELNNGTLTFWKNGVSLGVAFTGITGTLYPMASVWRNDDAIRARFAAAEISSMPAGATAWDGAPAAAGAKWWRVSITENNGYEGAQVAELQFRSTPGGTSLTTPAGATTRAFATSTYDAVLYPAAHAFDNDPVSVWFTDIAPTAGWPQRVGYGFSSPVAVNEISLVSVGVGGMASIGARDFTIESSNDSTTGLDGTWATEWSVTGQTDWSDGESRVFTRPAAEVDPHWANVVSLLHFDGLNNSTTFVDEKGKVWTSQGNARIDTSQSKFGGASLYLDGSGDYLFTPETEDFGFGEGDFTVECWMRSTALDTVIFDQRSHPSDAGVFIANHPTRGNGIAYYQPPGVSGGTVPSNDGEWHHYAWSRKNGVFRMFQDGAMVYDSVNFTSLGDARPGWIGAQFGGSAAFFAGHIDEMRITKGVGRYVADFAPPDAPYPDAGPAPPIEIGPHWDNVVALLNASGADGSTVITDATGRIWTPAGDAHIDTSLGYNAIYFDGSGDRVTTPYEKAAFDWWTGDYTVEAWVWIDSQTTWEYVDGEPTPALIGCANPDTTENYWSLGPVSGGRLAFYYYYGATQRHVSPMSLTENTLHHIAMTKTAAGIYLAANGLTFGPIPITGTPQSSDASPVVLTLGQIAGRGILGSVRAVRISRQALYVGNYTPQSAPFPES